MKDKNKNWLSDYAPTEIALINSDPTTAQISLVSRHIRREDKVTRIENLTIPPKLINDPLCLALIAYCKSDVFLNLSPGTRKDKYRYFRSLFLFLDKRYGQQRISDVTSIHPDYINALRKERRDVRVGVSTINVALKWYIEQKNNNLEYVARVKATQARIPKISSRPNKPRPALSELIESVEYDDITLIKSLREFSVIMLNVMNEQRCYLLSVPEIVKAKSSLSNLSKDIRKLIEQGVNGPNKVTSALTQTYIKPIWDAISSSNDGLLIERMLLNCGYTRAYIQNREEPMTLEDQRALLEQHLGRDGSLISNSGYYYYRTAKKKKTVSTPKLSNLSYNSLSQPTKAEEVLISLLLASERVQPSGQFELSIDDYYITGDTGSWDFSKKRSIAKEHPSRLYSVNSSVHQTYLKYIQLCNSEGSQQFSVGRSLQSTQTRLTYSLGTEYDPYLSVALKGSYLRSWLLRKHPSTKPFIDLLTKICEHNDPRYNSYGKHKGRMINIALSYVAQSVAINFRRRNVRTKQSTYERYGQSIVEAALDAHTPETKKNIYVNRSETITRINERKWFSEIVSEEMVTDALNIKAVLSNSDTQVISLSEARKLLGFKGIEPDPDPDEISKLGDFLGECAEMSYKTGYFADVTLDSKKIIVEIPITAALILSYQSKLEKELKRDTYVSNRRKAYMLSRYLYIEEILNAFEPSVIEQGKELLEQFEIPSPPIFVENL